MGVGGISNESDLSGHDEQDESMEEGSVVRYIGISLASMILTVPGQAMVQEAECDDLGAGGHEVRVSPLLHPIEPLLGSKLCLCGQ